MNKKVVEFHGSSRKDLIKFPDEMRHEAGHQIDRVQCGLDPDDWKPMPDIGLGVKEIRLKDSNGIYRVIYVASFSEKVHILHAFQKKTVKTSRKDIALAKKRFKAMKNG